MNGSPIRRILRGVGLLPWGGIGIALAIVLTLSSCVAPVSVSTGKTGLLILTFSDGVSRTIVPSISMVPATYEAVGTGPNGATFTEVVSGTTGASVQELGFGDWSIVVTARNSEDTPIGEGSATATVHTNQATSVAISVTPYHGTGVLSLVLLWPAAGIEVPEVTATLDHTGEASRALDFLVDKQLGTATFSADDVEAGYYTLTVKLMDNGALAAAAVEVVRVLAGQTTGATLQFDQTNSVGGSLSLSISPSLGDPLTVSVAGATQSKPTDQTLTLTSSIAETGVTPAYTWYVNGEAAGTGSSFIFDTTWPQGLYRIDVTAFSADMTRGGSAGATISVTAPGGSGTTEYVLTTGISGWSTGRGTVDVSPAGSSFAAGTVVSLTAVPDPGSTFVGWAEAGASQYQYVSAANPLTITINGDTTYFATMAVPEIPNNGIDDDLDGQTDEPS